MRQLGTVDDILKSIKSGDIKAGVDYFFTLPQEKRSRFLEQIGGLKDESVALFLTELFPTVEEKTLKKLIKRLLFLLGTKGIRIEQPAVTEEPALRKMQITREQLALGSNYDHENTRVVLLAFNVRKKQYIFTHATERFGEGLIDVMSAPIQKQGLDGLVRDYRSRIGSSMVLVDIAPAYAIYLLEEGARRSGRHADEIKVLKRMMGDVTGGVRTPSDIYRLEVSPSMPEIPWKQVLYDKVFAPFTLNWKGIDEDEKDFAEIANPGIVLPPHIVEEKRAAYLKELVLSERLKSLRADLVRLLEDYAYLFYCQGEYVYYSTLVRALQSEETIDSLLPAFVRKTLEKKPAEQQKQQHDQGLIINPYTGKP